MIEINKKIKNKPSNLWPDKVNHMLNVFGSDYNMNTFSDFKCLSNKYYHHSRLLTIYYK